MTRSPVKPKSNRKLRWIKYPLAIGGGLAAVYGLTAYAILPLAWNHYEHNPKLATSPKITHTKDGIPGDPLNIGLVGTQPEIIHTLLLAGWYPADPVTLKTSIGIARSVLLKHPYPTAPVSNLYFFGRKQDLAFERPVGSSASQRHHIRLWQSADVSASSQPLWLGSATFDLSSGFSHLTGQITHHIAADIDRERDLTIDDLNRVQQISSFYQVTGVGATWDSRNGGGDRYYTDGELTIASLSSNNLSNPKKVPVQAPNPPAIQLKQQIWQWIKRLL